MAKRIPKLISDELRFHDFGMGMVALMDYAAGKSARDIVARLKKSPKRIKPGCHFDDPCRFCGVGLSDVKIGDCAGNPKKKGDGE